MNQLLLFTIGIFFLFYFPPSNGISMSCIEVSTTISTTFYSIQGHNSTVTANWNLYEDSATNKTYLILSNANGFDGTENLQLSTIYYDFYYSNGIEQTAQNFSNPFVFDLFLDEPLAWFYANFSPSWKIYAFMGYIDDGMISSANAGIFDPVNSCIENNFNGGNSIQDMKTCCTAFVPAPEVPQIQPKCNNFRSRIILYNSDYSIFATSSMNFALNGTQVKMTGSFSGAESVLYYFNGDSCDTSSSNLTCSTTLPPGDSKSFFATIFIKNQKQYVVPRVRAFLLRQNQTLMKDGEPFTTKNNCIYYKFTEVSAKDGGASYPTTVETCCKEFES